MDGWMDGWIDGLILLVGLFACLLLFLYVLCTHTHVRAGLICSEDGQ